MSTLYELTSEYLELLEMAEDPDTDPETLADTLEALGGEIGSKADGYGRVIRQIEADIESIKAEEKRLAERRRAMDANRERMMRSLQSAMEITGMPRIKTDLFSFVIQKNPPSVVITGEVPEIYLVPQEPKVDKVAIKDALKAGEELPWAHLEQSEKLRIK